MRRSLLSLTLVLLVAACGGSSSATGDRGYIPPPGHHQPPPDREEPPPTPYDTTTFEDPGTNPFVDAEEDRESTFGLDVDTASYTVARRFLNDGNLPDPASVRVEEYINFFDHEYPAPGDETFAIYGDGGPSPFLPDDEVLLRIGLKARDVHDRARPDAALTFVIDVSGSMEREDRLELVKQSLALLVDGLGRRDTVAIVVYGDDARVVLPPTSAKHDDEILRAIDSLHPEGSTNAEAGIRLGYEIARETFLEGGINRVVLASDGVANVGAVDPDTILRRIRDDAEAGIQLVAIGVGMGNFNDALLERLADRGDGFYAYIDDLDEARRLFTEELTATLQSVALDARVQVEFEPDLVAEYRLVGYENREIDDEDFRDDHVDAGAIGAGHEVTALYALRLRDGAGHDPSDDGHWRGNDDYALSFAGELATVHVRWIDPDSGRADELRHAVRVSDLAPSFRLTAGTFQLDALVAAAAEHLRDSRWGRQYDLTDVLDVADEIAGDLPRTDAVHDFLDLLEEAASIER